MKKVISFLVAPCLIILSFSLEESVKDYSWFRNLVGIMKIFVEHIGVIGTFITFTVFNLLWVNWLLEDKFTKKTNLIAKYIFYKLKAHDKYNSNVHYFLSNYNTLLNNNVNEAFKSFKIKLSKLDIKTGEHIIEYQIPVINMEFGKDPRITNPHNEPILKAIEIEFKKEFNLEE